MTNGIAACVLRLKCARVFRSQKIIHVLAIFLYLGLGPITAHAFNGNLASTPDPNAGDYTISWTNSTGDPFTLQERLPGASTYTDIVTTSGTSRVFSGKAPGQYYNYRLKHTYEECSGWPEPFCYDVTEYSEVLSIVVEDDGITSAPSEGTVDTVGHSNYGIDVASDGDAVISVPILAIPGVAGFEPSVSIEYDSGRGIDRLEQSLPEDTIGYGWRVAGLSQIRRCVVDQASGNSINLTSSDSLCLNGMPLVLVSGTHFVVGATYRTQIENYAKAEIKGAVGSLWFEVTLPDGTIQEYGNGGYSRVDQNGGTDYQWSINKATSTDGNIINYLYWHDISQGINYIVNIEYTGAEIDFDYLARTDTAAVSIGSASQTQSVFLHTIRVKYNGTNVREYRLLNEVVDLRRRLNKIQHCGYDEGGITLSCLSALDINWLTPLSTMAGVDILVDGMTDSMGADFNVEYGTITGSSHPFLFTERPFGNGTPPADTQILAGAGALRHVATKLRRDNGLGGFHDTTYAYQNKGLESTKHWGFLGFYAQRITDEQSGIVTYVQYRLDYPYFGRVARLFQYNDVYPSHTELLTRVETEYDKKTINHVPNKTFHPYTRATTSFIYEGGQQLGASKTWHSIGMTGGFPIWTVRRIQVGTSVTEGTPGSIWGEVPIFTIGSLLNTNKTTIDFENRTTAGQWLVNFPADVKVESWPGAQSGTPITRDVEFVPEPNSLNASNVTRFPNDPFLTLSTGITYDPNGRATSTLVNGDNVSNRTTSIPSFLEDRYPGQVTNTEGFTTTFNSYDVRFGTVKSTGSPIGRITTRARDPFGRVTSTTNGDGVVTTTTYTDCPTGCGILVYGVAPSYFVQTDSIVEPIRNTYFDALGRVIRAETESFSGASYSKQDVKYDTQGRVERSSLPYFSGTPHDVIPTYDIRNRITNVSRPDGSSTGTVYGVSGSTIVVTITDNVKTSNGASAGAQVKRNEYNILGQLTQTTDGYGTSTDPSTTYTYDANGNVLTAAVNGGTAGSTTTTFEYDAAGNQTKIVGPDFGTVTSTYTGLDQLMSRTDNLSQVTNYAYDRLGRLWNVAGYDSNNQLIVNNSWSWDAVNGIGKQESRRDISGFTESYEYNNDGRLEIIRSDVAPIGGTQGPANTFVWSHTYDIHGRPLNTSHPTGFVVTREYNARGYLSQLKDGTTAIQTINDQDAFGNSIDESYANGVNTLRTFDPENGRLTDVNTTKGVTVFQDNDYAWRSNGTLESRIANPASGLATTRKESFVYDVLNRVTLAETYINSSNTRDLSYVYDQLGNITSKTSTLPGDNDVTGYAYGAGAAGPHAVTSASVDGVGYTLTYNGNGAVTQYDIAGTTDDKYIEYNAFNQPTKIVIGSSLTDPTPVAKDEFAYGPNGQRYARTSSWQEGASTVTEEVRYIGAVEYMTVDDGSSTQTVVKTRLTPNVMHVKIIGTTTETFFEYAHRDHLGSIEVVTDDNGNVLDNLAFEPLGARKTKDWTANISTIELDSLLDLSSGHSRKARGFTGHEHLDRTGFVHMNGRVYDPVLGRFLSPDPFVPNPTNSQSWNRYSYVRNSPLSLVDPSGFTDLDDFDRRRGFASPCDFFDCDESFGFEEDFDPCDYHPVECGDLNDDLSGREISQTGEAIDDALLDECRRVGCDFDFSTSGVDNTEIGQFIQVFKAVSDLYIVGRLNGLFGRSPSISAPSAGSARIGGATTSAEIVAARTNVSLAESIAAGTVRPGGNLAKVLGSIERVHAMARPGNVAEAAAVIQRATSRVGLDAGFISSVSSSGEVVLSNAGVFTTIGTNGSIVVTRGTQVVFAIGL